jgi:hypothetical protein
LRKRAFRHSGWQSDEQLARYFQTVFFDSPWAAQHASIVYDTPQGIVGFLGILHRPFRWGDRPLVGAVTTQFMVAPEHRGLAGALIIDRLFKGTHDFSMADVANEAMVRRWQAQGGSTAHLYALYWSKPLRKTTSAFQSSSTLFAKVVRKAFRPGLKAIDGVRGRLGGAPPKPMGTYEDIDLTALHSHIDAIGGAALRPVYSADSLSFLQARMREKWPAAALHCAVVRDDEGRLAGTFVYTMEKKGQTQVLQLLARDRTGAAYVVPRLLRHAYDRGATHISGRMERRCIDQLAGAQCIVQYRGHANLIVHAREVALLHHILNGEALLSGLDGEWWMMF